MEHAALDLVALGPTAVVITLGAEGAVAAVADKVIVKRAFPLARHRPLDPFLDGSSNTAQYEAPDSLRALHPLLMRLVS